MSTQIQNFYEATITRNWTATTGDFNVSVAPTISSGYLVISPSSTTLREIIKFSATGSNAYGPFVTVSNIGDRGLGGTTAQVHSIGEKVRMNITAQHWDDLNASAIAPTADVGTTTTLAPGSSATVTNSGTTVNAIFNFGIPKGDTGATGPQGPQGIQGIQGETGPQGIQGETGAAGGIAPVVTTLGNPGSDTNVPSEKLMRNELDGKQPAGTYSTDIHSNITALNAVSGTNTGDQTISDATISLTDITTNNASSTKHGFLPKLDNTGTKYLRDDGTWQTISSGSALWTLMPGTPTRTSNTSFTVTGDVTSYVAKGMIIKWTESSTVRCAMVSIPSTFGSPNTTITIIGDTMASIDASSLKYCMLGAEMFQKNFAVAGTIGATGTDVANAYYATEPMRVIGADLQVGTAGTTNSTTIDINKGGTTMFTTKPTLATTVAYSPTPFTADTATSLALGDRVSIDIDAVQTTKAIDLYVQLYLLPTRYLSLS